MVFVMFQGDCGVEGGGRLAEAAGGNQTEMSTHVIQESRKPPQFCNFRFALVSM